MEPAEKLLSSEENEVKSESEEAEQKIKFYKWQEEMTNTAEGIISANADPATNFWVQQVRE